MITIKNTFMLKIQHQI